MSLRTPYDLADLIHAVFPTLQWISGKWFRDGRYIKEYDVTRLLASTDGIRCKLTKSLTPANGESAFIDLYGDFEGKWLPLPLAEEALKKGPLGECPDVFKFINDPRKILIINRLVFHPYDNNKMIIICGVGGSGKSTYLNVIDQCFQGDTSHTDLSSLLSDNTIMATALQSRLILSDELRGEDVTNPMIKQIINQQKITTRKVFEGAREINSQSQLIFATNKPPRFDITDSGMMRRVLFYRMDKKVGHPEVGLDKKKFSDDELVELLRYSLIFDDQHVIENQLECKPWDSFFEKDTRGLIKDCCHIVTYRQYEKDATLCKDYYTYSRWAKDHGYKAYNYTNFLDINGVLDEWEEEKK